MPTETETTAAEQTEQTVETKVVTEKAPAGKTEIDSRYEQRLRREAEEHRKEAEAARAEAKALREEKEKAELAKLEADKEFQKVAEFERKRADKAEADAAERLKGIERNAKLAQLEVLAKSAGMLDLDDVSKIDIDALALDDRGRLSGADEALAKLKEAKPHYFAVEDEKATKRRTTQVSQPAADKGGDRAQDAYALSPEDFSTKWQTLGQV